MCLRQDIVICILNIPELCQLIRASQSPYRDSTYCCSGRRDAHSRVVTIHIYRTLCQLWPHNQGYQMLNNANLYYILFAIREVYIYLK